MRPQQQNRRMRGRNNGGGGNNNNNNNNRKGPNPLTRNYESNGPDVKIRGSAQQIAEKYATLARDAASSGDRVMAENYLQHAEHYNRIIAAAQAQFASQQVHVPREDADDEMDEGYGFEGGSGGNTSPENAQPVPAAQHSQPPVDGSGPQPVIEGVPAEVALNSEPVGQPTGGGRQRERRRQNHQNDGMNGFPPAPAEAAVAEQPEPTGESGPAAEAAAGDEPAAPRRGRRPRRRAEPAAGEQPAPAQGAELATSES